MTNPPSTTVPVTIYGASDDLFDLETPDRSIYEEYDCCNTCVVRLTAPNGETFDVYGAFGESPLSDWEVRPYGDDNADWAWENSRRPDRESDPAIIVHVPVGTTAERIDDED